MRKRCRCRCRNVFTAFDRCAGSPSQKSARRPLTERMRCLSVRMVSSDRTAPFLTVKYARGFFPRARTVMMPVTERVFHEPVVLMIGVFPRFPQVFRMGGFSENADSSRKQKIAFNRPLFLAVPATLSFSTLRSSVHSSLLRVARVFDMKNQVRGAYGTASAADRLPAGSFSPFR